MTTYPDRLHRTAKYFMDSGRAATAEDAIEMLARFGLAVSVDATAAAGLNGQIALLTLVNTARRTMLGGIEVEGVGDEPVVTTLASEGTLREAIEALGATCVERVREDWPRAMIGDAGASIGAAPSWGLHWAGWRGGVVPARWPASPAGDPIRNPGPSDTVRGPGRKLCGKRGPADPRP